MEEADVEVVADIELTDSNHNDDEQLLPKHRRESSSETEDEQTLPIKDRSNNNPALASDFKTFGNTIISFVGSGILGLPFAFRQAGWMVRLYKTSF